MSNCFPLAKGISQYPCRRGRCGNDGNDFFSSEHIGRIRTAKQYNKRVEHQRLGSQRSAVQTYLKSPSRPKVLCETRNSKGSCFITAQQNHKTSTRLKQILRMHIRTRQYVRSSIRSSSWYRTPHSRSDPKYDKWLSS